jgi:hypothetical protein
MLSTNRVGDSGRRVRLEVKVTNTLALLANRVTPSLKETMFSPLLVCAIEDSRTAADVD